MASCNSMPPSWLLQQYLRAPPASGLSCTLAIVAGHATASLSVFMVSGGRWRGARSRVAAHPPAARRPASSRAALAAQPSVAAVGGVVMPGVNMSMTVAGQYALTWVASSTGFAISRCRGGGCPQMKAPKLTVHVGPDGSLVGDQHDPNLVGQVAQALEEAPCWDDHAASA